MCSGVYSCYLNSESAYILPVGHFLLWEHPCVSISARCLSAMSRTLLISLNDPGCFSSLSHNNKVQWLKKQKQSSRASCQQPGCAAMISSNYSLQSSCQRKSTVILGLKLSVISTLLSHLYVQYEFLLANRVWCLSDLITKWPFLRNVLHFWKAVFYTDL